jgi:hypothetical protein
MYYNTTALTGKNLKAVHRATAIQDDAILRLFKVVDNASPWEIYVLLNKLRSGKRYDISLQEAAQKLRKWGDREWGIYFDTHKEVVPITSVRRSISDLTDRGLLIKSENSRTGAKGTKEYIWQLKQPKL